MSTDLQTLLHHVSRRQLLQTVAATGFSLAGLPVPVSKFASARDRSGGPGTADGMFGRAKSVIFLWLSGGPPQHETFDPKPGAPAEIRGPFQPISTNVPGIHYCELLPRIAAMADKLAVVRSLFTNNNIHGGSGYWLLTGRQLITGDGENPRPDDWPFLGSIVKLLKPSERLPALTSVTLPEIFIGNGGNLEAGQFGGFLGTQWNPEIIRCNPADPGFQLSGQYEIPVPRRQFQQRLELLEKITSRTTAGAGSAAAVAYGALQKQAFELLDSSAARRAFAIDEETPETRDRYGRRHWGQSVLLARRLVEAGVRFVSVNWPRVPGDRGVDNPLWDTHARNFDRMEDCLAPQFDIGFTALLEDLEQRGLLAETLVVAVGEFGRTPQVNANAGRDHWGGVFSAVLAGAGIAGGQVFGSSDKHGAYPATDAVNAGHLPATIFHLLGIDPQGTFRDREGRELSVCDVQPLYRVMGDASATTERTSPTGQIERVPAYTPAPLIESGFSSTTVIRPLSAPASPKGWRATPCAGLNEAPVTFGVALLPAAGTADPAGSNRRQAAVGIVGFAADSVWTIDAGSTAVLAQQIRDPQAGRFVVKVGIQGDGSSREFFETVFQKHFRCRLTLFQFTEPTKSAAQRRELAAVEIRPVFQPGSTSNRETFVLEKYLGTPGGNFSFGLGIGVAIIVDRITEGPLELPARAAAFLRVDHAEVVFQGQVA